jgi:hypothetical protein
MTHRVWLASSAVYEVAYVRQKTHMQFRFTALPESKFILSSMSRSSERSLSTVFQLKFRRHLSFPPCAPHTPSISILFYLINLAIGLNYVAPHATFSSFLSLHSSYVRISLYTLFSSTLSLCFFFNVKDQVS